jgi:capsular polysaccharide biosynthesis protein
MAITFLLEYAQAGIIRSHEDIDRSLNVPVLGTIPPTE